MSSAQSLPHSQRCKSFPEFARPVFLGAVMNTWPLVLRACSSNGKKPLRRFTSSSPITSSISSIGGEPWMPAEIPPAPSSRRSPACVLAFAAELRGGFFVVQQLQIVAVRPDQRGARTPFARPRLRQFHGKVLFHARLIFDAQFLGVIGNTTIVSRASGENFGTSSRRARMISLPSFTGSRKNCRARLRQCRVALTRRCAHERCACNAEAAANKLDASARATNQ